MNLHIKKILEKFSRSIGSVVVVLFFGLGLITTIFFSIIDYDRKLDTQVSNLNRRLDQVKGGYIESLSNSLWKIDDEQTSIILESILRQEDIEQVKIVDKDKVLYEKGKKVETKYVLNRTYPLVVKYEDFNKYLGELEIYASKKNMRKLLTHEFKISLFQEFLKILFFVLSALAFIKLVIIRHLDAITRFFMKKNIYNSQAKLVLNRDYEVWKMAEDNFDVLVNSINIMVEKLHEELQDRKKAELELKHLNESLEKRVEDKTRQLLERDRFEAVSELSAGIAHEINSPLSVIFGLNRRLEKIVKGGEIKIEDVLLISSMSKTAVNKIFAITNAMDMLSDTQVEKGIAVIEEAKIIDETMIDIQEIYRTNVGSIEYICTELPTILNLNKHSFYQLIYILVHLRSNSMESIKDSWIRLEFNIVDGKLAISCYDNGVKLTESEKQSLATPFKAQENRIKGSQLIFGTFSSLVRKIKGQFIFTNQSNDIFIQIVIPIKDLK